MVLVIQQSVKGIVARKRFRSPSQSKMLPVRSRKSAGYASGWRAAVEVFRLDEIATLNRFHGLVGEPYLAAEENQLMHDRNCPVSKLFRNVPIITHERMSPFSVVVDCSVSPAGVARHREA